MSKVRDDVGTLLLWRKRGQSVRIGRDVTVTVTETREGKTRLMFRAPRNVKILRTELERTASHDGGSV